MSAIVFGSPEANEQRALDRQIEALPPCRCGAPPVLGTLNVPDNVDIWYIVECSDPNCSRSFSNTLPKRKIEEAIGEWSRTHEAVQS